MRPSVARNRRVSWPQSRWLAVRIDVRSAMLTVWVVLASLSLGFPTGAQAQITPAGETPADTVHQVRLQDGTTLYGRVVFETEDGITLETAGGTRVSLERVQIRSMRTVRGRIVDGRFLPQDPNRTRLFFAPSARPLDRGEAYISSYMLFFPFAGIGVTDRFAIAGGTPILPRAMGEVFYLAPKYTVAQRSNIDLAVGALAFFATRELDEGSVGVLYGAGTFGDPDQAVTAGVGWGFSLGGGDARIENDPVLMAGGELRIGEHTKLLTENWFVIGGGSSGGILTGGIRFFGEALSADLGLGMGFDREDSFCCLPLVNFVYNFRRGG